MLLIFSMPNSIFAYSNYIIPGGENIGIEIKTQGVVVVGTYPIDEVYPADQAGIKKGDIIYDMRKFRFFLIKLRL